MADYSIERLFGSGGIAAQPVEPSTDENDVQAARAVRAVLDGLLDVGGL
jgi:hypothetical protein